MKFINRPVARFHWEQFFRNGTHRSWLALMHISCDMINLFRLSHWLYRCVRSTTNQKPFRVIKIPDCYALVYNLLSVVHIRHVDTGICWIIRRIRCLKVHDQRLKFHRNCSRIFLWHYLTCLLQCNSRITLQIIFFSVWISNETDRWEKAKWLCTR